MPRSLRILFTDIELESWSGAKIVLRDFALSLRRRGHMPLIYSPRLGLAAKLFKEQGLEVVDDLDQLSSRPDIIQGHHNIPTVMALARFPGCPAIWFCHSRFWTDIPPRFLRIHRYIAVDLARRNFLHDQHRIAADRIEILHNAVDLTRIPPRLRPLSAAPRTALAFTKFRNHLLTLQQTCTRLGLVYDAIGAGPQQLTPEPEKYLVRYDIVFATGRSAIEALCAGAAVIVGDGRGLAGMVTPRNYSALRDQNFGSGSDILLREITPRAVEAEIKRYNAAEAELVTAKIRDEANLERALDRVEQLHDETLEAQAGANWSRDDAISLRDFLDKWPAPKDEFVAERQKLIAILAGL